MARQVRPAEGEGWAAAGYRYQYLVSALLVLHGLRDGSLGWVRIKDVDAGRVDDFVLGGDNCVDAYQVKHRARPLSFRGLTRDDLGNDGGMGNASLVRQLADGWQLLKETYGPRVVVHLVTNARPSSDDRITTAQDAGPRHFAAFLQEAWRPAHDTPPGTPIAVPAKWDQSWEDLRRATNLPADEFPAFVRDCHLEFEFDPLADAEDRQTRDREQLLQDIDHIRHAVFDLTATPEAPITLDRGQLVARLGWRRRFEPRNPHDFPVDEALYQPIRASVEELPERLAGVVGGYVGVFGTPGSGKSSLLTHVLRFRPERLIRYYAYVPDAQDPSVGRGEAENFLHDLVLALDREGIKAGAGLIPYDRAHLAERFRAQLALLHDDWVATGTRTLILVDGLDHVAREQRPERSLLDELPTPDRVPEGVVFVLGSQTDVPLPDRVQHAVRQPGRRVEMQPLSREEVHRVVAKASLRFAPSDDQRDRITALSAGHPLALVYLLNRLRDAEGATEAEGLLDETLRYEGDIAAQYHSQWRTVEDDARVARALGYLARLRGPVDPDWLRSWVGFEAVDPIRRRFAHFFRREGRRWYFFHDSFRAYLLDRTAEGWPGEVEPERHAELHSEIADRCAAEASDSRWAWEELYHRFRAGQHERVLERASQDYFRRQFLALRPAGAIGADVALALRSAAALQDPVAFCRLVLTGAELSQRSYHLERVPFVRLLMEVGDPLAAADHLQEGQQLRVPQREALETCPLLADAGLTEEAARLFDLAEPLSLLGSAKPIENDYQGEVHRLVETWAEVAPGFRSLEQFVQVARRLHVKPPDWDRRGEDAASRDLRNRVLFHAGLGLLALQRWDEVGTVAAAFEPGTVHGAPWCFWLETRAWRDCLGAGAFDRAKQIVNGTIGQVRPGELGPEARATMAEAAYRVLGDEDLARRWLQDVPQPEIDATAVPLDAGFQPFLPRLRLNRLRYALGEAGDAAEIVPEPANPEHRGLSRFEQFVCVVAWIQAAAWRGDRLPPAAIVAMSEPYLHLFDLRLDRTDMGVTWFIARRARGELVERLVEATRDHGPEAVEALRSALKDAWRSATWTVQDRRAAVIALAQAGAPRPWAVAELAGLEATMLQGQLAIDRVRECQRQAEAWLALGDPRAARRLLDVLLREANTVAFRKDHQLADWIGQWLAPANAAEPDAAAGRVAWLARAALVLDRTTEDGAERSAAEALLGAAFRWSPRRAVALLRWCLAERLVALDDALAAMLLAALDAPAAPLRLVADVLTELVLPIAASGPSPALLRRLVGAVADADGQDAAVALVRSIADRVATYALPSARDDWRRFLREALEGHGIDPGRAGLARPDPNPAYVDEHPTPLRLRDGSALAGDEVAARATTVQGLLAVLGPAEVGSYFDWLPIVERAAEGASAAELLGLAEAFEGRHDGNRVLPILAERLEARGDREGAGAVALKLLDAAEPWGWDRRWGGGSKIDAARRLVGIFRARAVPGVYDRLVADLAAEPGRFATVAQNLGEILPLLVETVPVQAIWAEVEDFARALFAAHALPEADLGFLAPQPEHDSAARALGDLAAMHLRHPAWVLSQGAQRVCAEGILRGDAALVEAARDGLAGPEDLQEATVELLDAVALRDPAALRPLRDDVVRLSGSPNFAVRSIAAAICDRSRWPHPGVRCPRPRPAAYDLVVPPGPRLDLSPAAARAVAAASGDPRLLLRPFDATLRLVAEVAGLPAPTVLQRAAGLMREIADPSTWSREAEEHLTGNLRAAGLYLTFRAPRPMVARRALFRVAAELVDAGDLDERGLARLAPWLAIHDPAMVLRAPAPRPAVVGPMPEPTPYGAWEAWLENVGESCGVLLVRREAEWDVLAEQTALRHLSHENPLEDRRIVAVPGAALPPLGDDGLPEVERVMGCPIAAYPDLDIAGDPAPLVVGNKEFSACDTPAPWWLALNPTVGREMGWTIDPAGLFRWVDGGGRTAVESVWWHDGVLGTHWSGPGQGELGEGWLVLASPSAADALRARCGSLWQSVGVARRLGDEESEEAPRRVRRCAQSMGW